MLYKTIWAINKIVGLLIFAIIGILPIKQDKNIWLFGLKEAPYKKENFYFNTKYMFLYLQEHCPDIKSIWLCDDKKMLKEFHNNGYKNVYTRHSIRGISAILKAKYWFCDVNANQITKYSCGLVNAEVVNFWHGAGGLKKVGLKDYKNSLEIKKDSLIDKFYKLLKLNDSFFIVNSEYEGNCRKQAFNATDEQIKILGSPRLDALFNEISGSDLFMRQDFEYIKNLKTEGKKIFVYMPTFRDTGKDISSWLLSENLKIFLKNNNAVLLCKLHHQDKNPIDFNSEVFYKVANTSDIYPILKYTDALITDYSSVFFDYLLLDKPILYYIPDLEEYTTQCRGFYEPYENLTAGIYAKTEDELLQGLSDIINGVDNYKEKRKALLDRMFVYQDGNNCKRNLEFIKGLNK